MNGTRRMRRIVRRLSQAAVAVAVAIASAGSALAISQSGEQKDMRRVGHTDLQGRAAYHPDLIRYPDGRWMLFVGTHSNTTSNGPKLNPLTGSVEPNGTMIIDVTDPRNPVEKFHIPGPAFGGITPGGAQTQSNRLCLGSDLPAGPADKNNRVYLLRNVQVGAAAVSGYEVWDVTNVAAPFMVSEIRRMRNTHKPWWECKSGIAYLPGSMAASAVPAAPQWRQGQSLVVVNWGNPTLAPTYLRTYGLPGSQPLPVGTGPTPTSLHGAISAYEHPNANGLLARGTVATGGTIGNRVYLAWGVGDDGVLQVLDRSKLLPPPFGTYAGPDGWTTGIPTNAQLEEAQTSVLYLSPDQGGHTSFPVFGMKPKSYEDFTEFLTRDIVVLASESTADNCLEAPHWSFLVDVTVENSKTDSPPGVFPPKRALPNPWQGPQVLSTMAVDPRAGEKYPRGNYCNRGARYGVHSSEENFRNPFYGRVTFMAYFTGGVRAWDIREPQSPVEVAFYVPESNAFTEADGYMTNNLEVDNRGYIYAVDRNQAGMDILELHGKALAIGLGK